MSDCSAPHDDAAETGLCCALPEGHPGDHEAWLPVTWAAEDGVPVPEVLHPTRIGRPERAAGHGHALREQP